MSFLQRLRRWLSRRAEPPSDLQRANALIKGIDAGGIPLNPAMVNAIARNLGLDVSSRAPVGETIERIRLAVKRAAKPAE